MLIDQLQEQVLYNVLLNSSYDATAEVGWTVFTDDDRNVFKSPSITEVIDLFYRNDKTPVRKDKSVYNYKKNHAVMELLCAGRFSKQLKEPYHALIIKILLEYGVLFYLGILREVKSLVPIGKRRTKKMPDSIKNQAPKLTNQKTKSDVPLQIQYY